MAAAWLYTSLLSRRRIWKCEESDILICTAHIPVNYHLECFENRALMSRDHTRVAYRPNLQTLAMQAPLNVYQQSRRLSDHIDHSSCVKAALVLLETRQFDTVCKWSNLMEWRLQLDVPLSLSLGLLGAELATASPS